MLICNFENGGRAELRHVVTGVILLDETKRKILLVKRAPNMTCANLWALPGGYLDRDETIAQGALREVKEETGYEAKINTLLQIIDSPLRRKEDRQNVEFTYVAQIVRQVAKPDREISAIRWFGLNQIPPEPDFAFDHRSSVFLYCRFQKHPFLLPIITSK